MGTNLVWADENHFGGLLLKLLRQSIPCVADFLRDWLQPEAVGAVMPLRWESAENSQPRNPPCEMGSHGVLRTYEPRELACLEPDLVWPSGM